MVWSRLGSNQRPPACEAGALPLSHGTGAERRTTSKISTRSRLGRTRCIRPQWRRAAWYQEICAGPLRWTIVVLRTGRRPRPLRADVAQLVAHHLAKVRVAGSNPVIRSKVQVASDPTVEWPSGEATACKAVHTGSIPVSTSKFELPARLAQRESASLTRKRSLVQSQYRAPASLQLRACF